MNAIFVRTRHHRAIRHYRWWLVTILVVLALAAAWTARAPILRAVADVWVVSDPLDRAEAIVVLAGRIDVRPFAAADLYKRQFAPKVLISNVMLGPLETLELLPGQTALTRQLLIKLGVPSEAIVEVGDGVTSTYEEARAVLDWAKSSGARSVIILTDIFPSRRIRWTFRRELAPAGVRVIVYSVEPRGYAINNWWRDERGLIDFLNEFIKSVYYWISY